MKTAKAQAMFMTTDQWWESLPQNERKQLRSLGKCGSCIRWMFQCETTQDPKYPTYRGACCASLPKWAIPNERTLGAAVWAHEGGRWDCNCYKSRDKLRMEANP